MTHIRTTNGIVLRSVDYSETSLIVRIFTEDHGKVTVMSKGARRSKHGLGGMLKPLNLLAFTYRHRDNRDIQLLTACEFSVRYPDIAKDIVCSAAALMAVEMLDKSVQDDDPHPILYRLITALLAELNKDAADTTALMTFYQLHLSRQLGFAPHLDHCVHCGKALRTAVMESLVVRDPGLEELFRQILSESPAAGGAARGIRDSGKETS